MAVEIARGKEYFPGWNVARWWLSHEAHQRDPQRFLANFEAGLGIFAEHGILVMPVLFNRWRDPVCDFGGVPLDHLIPHHSAWTSAGRPVRQPRRRGPGRRARAGPLPPLPGRRGGRAPGRRSASTPGTCATSP